jgi:hypothetical protein
MGRGEPESRGRWTGDEDRARADQVPLEYTVKGATGRARGLTGSPPLPATPFLCHYEALQETDPADIGLLVHIKVEVNTSKELALGNDATAHGGAA